MRKIIQVGVGGYDRTWLDTVALFRDRAEYAALVDVDDAPTRSPPHRRAPTDRRLPRGR